MLAMKQKRSDRDRRIRQADRFARVLRLLQLIQGRGRWNIPDLATKQECSGRSVHRDLQVLELAGVPLCGENTVVTNGFPEFPDPVVEGMAEKVAAFCRVGWHRWVRLHN